jgi:predicted enzyme related to lactoylglutathione lyase
MASKATAWGTTSHSTHPRGKDEVLGQPVVHFEVVGKDVDKLRSYYGELFGWDFNSVEGGPTDYATVDREANVNADGVGIGGGIGGAPEGYDGHVTFYVEVPDVGASLAKAEELGGSRMMGPEQVVEGLEIGLFTDPEGHVIGLVKTG